MTQKEQIEKQIADRQSWLKIIEADERGEVIQANHSGVFMVRKSGMNFDFERIEYRIKPKPRECWRLKYADGELGDRCYDSSASASLWTSADNVKAVKFVEVIE